MRFFERARIHAFAAAGMVSAFFVPRAAIAQQQAANANLERFNRQLEQLQRQTLLQADQSLTLDQRTFFDYGAFATFGYLSLDDNVGDYLEIVVVWIICASSARAMRSRVSARCARV